MGMMAKMRSLAPWFIITVGGLFVLFMVLSDSKITNIIGQRSNNIGYVNDDPITYKEFSQYLESVRKQQTQQGRELDETQTEQLRDQVWEAMVAQKLIQEKIDEYGIEVSDQEIKDQILGPNPPAFLRQSFIDSNGVFNRDLYEQALFDPRNKEALIQAENAIRQQLIQDKLRNYLEAAVVVTDGEVKRQYIEQTTKMSANFALVSAAQISDSAVTLTDKDIEKYYDEHKDQYRVEAQRKVKYVLFEKKATKEDTLGIVKNLEAIVNIIKNDTSSFKSFVNIYSDQPYSLDTLSINLVPPAALEQLRSTPAGNMVGPIITNQGAIIYNLIKKFNGKEEFARASHILIRGNDEKAKQKADEIYNELKNGADFAKVAAEKSQDPGSARRGGDLGWFGKGQMVPVFEKAVFSGRVGVIQKPVKSQFGWHIIKVTGKSREEFVVEKIVNKIGPSATTLDQIYNNANDFSYLANENSFESEADLMNYKVVETPAFSEGNGFIPGLGAAKRLVQFAFNNSVGDISEAVKVPAGYVVAKITDASKAGFQPLSKVKSRVKVNAMQDKKMEKARSVAEEIKSKLGENGDLSKASQINNLATFDIINDFDASGNLPKVGRDVAFTEYCLTAPLNQISNPINGNKGVYLIKVTKRTPFNEAQFKEKEPEIRNTMLQQQRNQYYVKWIDELKKNAEIVDNRSQFYR